MSNNNEFDNPDDLDLISDKDIADKDIADKEVDFDDFESGNEKSVGNSLKKSPVFKFGLIAAVVLAVLGAIYLFSGDEVETPQSFVGRGANYKETPGTKEVSPVMKEALEEKNQERIDTAEKQGMSAIPTPIEPPKAVLEVTDETSESDDPLLRWQQMQTERARAQREQQMVQVQQTPQDPQRESRVTTLAGAMSGQLQSILSDKNKQGMQHVQLYSLAALEGPKGLNGQAGNYAYPSGAAGVYGINNNNVNGTPLVPPKVVVPAGTVEYAQMLFQANSDVPGPVMALLASGKFKGGKLIGSFAKKDDYLTINFTTLVTKKGTSIPVTAYAVDPDTALTAVATDVDHRYLERIILPAAASFIQGLGEAYSQTTTSSSQNATTTTTTTTDLNTEQELGKAVADMAGTVGEILEEDGGKTETLVVIAAGTPVGIVFIQQVTDQIILQARGGGLSAAQPQSTTGSGASQNGSQNNQSQSNLNPLQQIQQGLQNQGLIAQEGSNTSTLQQQ